MKNEWYQQGDLKIERVDSVKGKRLSHLILAEGEATGHSHRVKTKTMVLDNELNELQDAVLYEDGGILYLKVNTDNVEVIHEEHKTIILPKGDWKIGKVLEYDHFLEESREVID